jgi:FkbM family methyltransferase
MDHFESATPSFLTVKSVRPDYGMQFEILVSILYHALCRSGDCVVDGGAGTGLHAVPLGMLVGTAGHVYCFEPNPAFVGGLARNLTTAGVINRCSIHAQPVADRDSIVEFQVNPEKGALSRIVRQPKERSNIIAVSSDTIDNVVGGSRIDFIKLDLEGADFLAIRGARHAITRGRPPIIFENSRGAAARYYGYTTDEFFQFFDDLGYRAFDLHGRLLVKDLWQDPDFRAPNYAPEFIALHKDDARRDDLMGAIRNFWTSVGSRPVLEKWDQCSAACRDPAGYMRSCGL